MSGWWWGPRPAECAAPGRHGARSGARRAARRIGGGGACLPRTGLGTALVTAFSQRDWMVIQNLVLMYGIVFTLVNLAIDVVYGLLDPRVAFR